MKILLIEDSNARLQELKDLLSDLPLIGFLKVDAAVYSEPPQGLDAVFMTLPAAERWSPDFKSRTAQILSTTQGDQEQGFPPFVVTGVNLTADDPTDAISQTRIILETALSKVRDYNAQNDHRIRTLGFWVTTLTNGVTTRQMSQLLHEVLLKVPDEDKLS
jgi:hypothetical protein